MVVCAGVNFPEGRKLRVAVVGGGPAGASAADQLAKERPIARETGDVGCMMLHEWKWFYMRILMYLNDVCPILGEEIMCHVCDNGSEQI